MDHFRLKVIDTFREKELANQVLALILEPLPGHKESLGGYVPDDVMDKLMARAETDLFDTFRNTALRFVLLHGNEVVGTVGVARDSDLVLHLNSSKQNVPYQELTDWKPPAGYHSALNFVIKKECRGRRLGTYFLGEIMNNRKRWFQGRGIWFRVDPPNHDAFIKLGCIHRTEFDEFCHIGVSSGKLSTEEYNNKYLCGCQRSQEIMKRMKIQKYKFGVHTIDFPV